MNDGRIKILIVTFSIVFIACLVFLAQQLTEQHLQMFVFILSLLSALFAAVIYFHLKRLQIKYNSLEKKHDKLKKTHMQISQMDKLRAISQLSSGITHEIKNPLSIIVLGLSYIGKRIPDKDKETQEMINGMKDAVNKADYILKGLFDLSRLLKVEIDYHEANDILNASMEKLEDDMQIYQVKVNRYFEDGLPKVKVDRNKMEIVFENILLNAMQAMEEGGQIDIKSYARKVSNDDIGVGRRKEDPFSEGDEVIFVEIEDTGTGIPENIIKRIFDPFFTTKDKTVNTGLGLSVISNIVELHKGMIYVDNRREGGLKTTVMLKGHTYREI